MAKKFATGETFSSWVWLMKHLQLATTDKACGDALEISQNSIVTMKKNGCDKRTALACAALLYAKQPISPEMLERRVNAV